MKLTNHITSSYMTAANALRSQNARRRIIAYVESYDDVLFWRTVLKHFEDKTRYFEIMLPSKSESGRKLLGRGKKSAMSSLLQNTGKDMIACVDADYDYLMQGATMSSQLLLSTPYVFHTYAYAIENLQCYAPGLHEVCVMATLNDSRIFDFEAFITDYSLALWPLFVWSVALYRHQRFDVMTIYDMDKIVSVGKIRLENIGIIINKVRAKAKQHSDHLRKSYPDIAKTLPDLRNELQQLGVTPETTYLYIHGHHLFENVVQPLLSTVCNQLVRLREQEIHQQAMHRTQMNNELSCYANSIEDITAMLKKNTSYETSPVFDKILSQIRGLMKNDE